MESKVYKNRSFLALLRTYPLWNLF